DAATGEVLAQAARRRTFAVISHPDAGKSTLTEALALHARVIGQAGAVHGKAGRRGTVSDWMDMEKARGISITSAALQFEYRDTVVNLLDTPGHADFSEDTYRVLTAVDAAVMLIDAAKGLEAQTMKLFAVCRHRGIPVITVVNKWDRPGKDALELMDEVAERTGLAPTPLTWPVGISGDFRGVLDRRDGTYRRFTRTAGGATIAPEETLTPAAAETREGIDWTRAVEE
ncbi:peptide chain release factor 3, partial [Modestobacter caceresii]